MKSVSGEIKKLFYLYKLNLYKLNLYKLNLYKLNITHMSFGLSVAFGLWLIFFLLVNLLTL